MPNKGGTIQYRKKPGPSSYLTKELKNQIRECVLEGYNNQEVAERVGLDPQRLYNWRNKNYKGIKDLMEGWRRDRKLKLANENIERLLQLDLSDKDNIRVVADMTKFVAETLGKENYSKRTENTGKDGAELPTPILAVQVKDKENE